MSDLGYNFPELPKEVEVAFRTAYHALKSILPDPPELACVTEPPDAVEIVSEFPTLADEADKVVIAHLGPRIAWQAPRVNEWDLTLAGVDLDNGDDNLEFGVKLSDSAFEGECGTWSDSALDLAARSYKREAGWDFAPGEAGFWLLMLAPLSGIGGTGEWSYFGRLTSFVILHDRDKDGSYESVAHMWTAHAWRRRGIAKRLLQEAKTRFDFRTVEGPLTEASAALLDAYPQLSGHQRDKT